MDPIWNRSSNELAFVNSFKMKLAVILGVTQMVMGIFMKGWNALYFKSKLDFFFEFLPQLCFMVFMFGYMILMIFIKWLVVPDYSTVQPSNTPPGIINMMINMFLKMGGTVHFL